jgi:hypothetical protein
MLSAICFLRYAWWAACVSGWIGLPSYAQNLKIAESRASFYLLSLLALQVATCATVWSVISLRYTDLSKFLRYGARLGVSAAITLAGTASLAWILGSMPYFRFR